MQVEDNLRSFIPGTSEVWAVTVIYEELIHIIKSWCFFQIIRDRLSEDAESLENNTDLPLSELHDSEGKLILPLDLCRPIMKTVIYLYKTMKSYDPLW